MRVRLNSRSRMNAPASTIPLNHMNLVKGIQVVEHGLLGPSVHLVMRPRVD